METMAQAAVTQRRLAAVLSADDAGYTKLMADDEEATLATLNDYRHIMSCLVDNHGGRVVDMVGDNLLAEFPSAVDAVRCALLIQDQLADRNRKVEESRQMRFRIGIHIGDLIVDGERIVGDGVNIAARIESMAPPGGVAMSQTVLDQVAGKLPIAVHDRGEHELKNVPRPVHIYEIADDGDSPPPEVAANGGDNGHDAALAGKHTIAVLPFRNLSRDPEQEYFADGLAEDLITSLASLRTYPVISRNSSFSYKDTNTDPRRIGHELGAHYVVAGSVRKSGRRVRVTAELVDAVDGHQVWSGRYDREMSDIFELQDELTLAIAGAVGPALSKSEIRHAIRRPIQSLDAWDCVHRGMWHMFQYTREHNEEARSWARRAIELAPDYAMAYSLVAFTCMYDILYQWTDDVPATIGLAEESSQKAIALDHDDPMALIAYGYTLSMSKQRDRAVSVLERAVEANPSSALASWALGATLRMAGQHDEAITWVEKAIRLSPQDELMHEFLFTIGSAHFLAGDYDAAIEYARRSLDVRADRPGACRLLAAAYGLMGQQEEAARALQQFERISPNFDLEHLRNFLPDEAVERYYAGLRAAGWDG
jgi:TolB-like protein/class 3 adenylate cyclase/Tfp pilus assembly protein PilF